MASILVTGGAGNIGGALVRKLADNPNNEIIVADNLLTGNLEKVPSQLDNVTFIKCEVNDYNDISPLFFAYRFDYVFHFAAVVGVQRTLTNPLWVLRDIRGIENILSLSKNTSVKRVYYSSSSEVYGEPFEIPQNEHTTPLNSRLPYAVVKNIGESYLRSYFQEYGQEYLIFRFFNTYGPNQSEDFVIMRFLCQALAGEDISIYGDGAQTRTFCYVDDTVDTCIAAHETGKIVNDTINVGSDQEITILSLAQKVIEVTASSSNIVHLPALNEGDMTRRCPDTTRMKDLLERELIPLNEGLERLIRFLEKGS